MSSKEFYKSLYRTFENMIKIEYTKQKRLSPILDKKAILLRAAIESKNEKIIDNVIFQILRNIPNKKIKNIQEEIILTRKNGRVYNISRNLGIKHDILDNSSNINYPSWLGYVFGDYKKDVIEKRQFENIIINKLAINQKEKIDQYWKYCKKIENSESETLDIEEMHKNIIISDNIDMEDTEKEKNEKIIISTIHKAKGKEFESVYLDREVEERKDSEDIIDYAKLLYVAITRAKKNCYKISSGKNKYKEYYAQMPEDERYLEYTYKYNMKKVVGHTNKSIRKIEIGLEKDIDKTSFINDNIIGNAQENIEYIKDNVKKGDYVDIIFEENKYYIYHNKRKIGKANIENLYEKAQKYLNKVKQMTYTPLKYSKVKIKRISTIAMFQEFIPSEIQNIYAKTGIWIGIELEGFGEIEWNNK